MPSGDNKYISYIVAAAVLSLVRDGQIHHCDSGKKWTPSDLKNAVKAVYTREVEPRDVIKALNKTDGPSPRWIKEKVDKLLDAQNNRKGNGKKAVGQSP